MHSLTNFTTLLEELISFTGSLIEIEAQKLESAQKNLVTFIEESMKKEQAAILKLRGLDRRREQIQDELGWSHLSFRDILSKASDQERAELEPRFQILTENLKVLKNTSESAADIMRTNLHDIDLLISAQDPSGNKKYTPDGTTPKPAGHFTNTKI